MPLLFALFCGLRRLLQQRFRQTWFKSTGVATPCGNRLHQDLLQLRIQGNQFQFIGGVLGGLLASATGCRAPAVFRDYPSGAPTGYVIDPALCTHCRDCARVCRCDAIGFDDDAHKGEEGPACRTCWVNLDKCCACGRCYRVCPEGAIVACYTEDKIPARELGKAKPEAE